MITISIPLDFAALMVDGPGISQSVPHADIAFGHTNPIRYVYTQHNLVFRFPLKTSDVSRRRHPHTDRPQS